MRASLGIVAILVIVASGLALSALDRGHPTPTAPASTTTPTVTRSPIPQASVIPTPWPSNVLAAFGPTGIPLTLGPAMPVLSPSDAAARAARATTPEPFLVGGWTQGVVTATCPPVPTRPRPAIDPNCRAGYTLGTDLVNAWVSPIHRLLFNLDGVALPKLGAVVLRVHADDPRSASCPPDLLAECRSTLVIDDVAWLGQAFADAAGSRAPLPPEARSCSGLSADDCTAAYGAIEDAARNFPTVARITVTAAACSNWPFADRTCSSPSATVASGVVLLAGQPGEAVYFNLVRTPSLVADFRRMDVPPAFMTRPFVLPSLDAGASCPQTPIGLRQDDLEYQGGDWAFVANLHDVAIGKLPLTDGWYGQKVFWAFRAPSAGPVLVRAARLDGNSPVGLGTDNDTSIVLTGEPTWPSTDALRVFIDGVSLRAPGCYAMQIDDATGSDTIVFRALP